MTETEWGDLVQPLIGKPFVWGSRGPGAFDCWGLVLWVLRGLGKPSPGDWQPDSGTPEQEATRQREEALDQGARMVTDWRHTLSPRPGDITLLSTKRRIHHAGVVTPFGVIHATKGVGVVLSSEASLRAHGYRRIEYYTWAG